MFPLLVLCNNLIPTLNSGFISYNQLLYRYSIELCFKPPANSKIQLKLLKNRRYSEYL